MNKENLMNIANMRNSFPKEIMKEIFKDCPEIKVKKNEIIYSSTDVPENVYWISEGMIEVCIINHRGQKQVIAFHYPDSIVGEIEALYGEPSSALTCIALKNSIIHKCNVEVFFNRIMDLGLMREYVRMLVGKTHANVLQLANVALDDCEARVNVYYNSELTHQQISELIGCSRVQVTRILNKEHKSE